MDELNLEYHDILETQNTTILHDDLKLYPLYSTMVDFIETHCIDKILISLSGGVDSMVLLELIDWLRTFKDISIHCCHLNYNNREESIRERDFLKKYCQLKNVSFDYKDIDFKRCDTKRNIYEKETRALRYDYYKEMCDKYGCIGVFLAHHKDDICENIFNNIMRGSREITDLTVIKEENAILGVNIYRPMLEYFKDDILEIAHNINIPYFLDTTPEWSCRGKMRRNIFPECEDCYSTTYKTSLLKIGKEGDELGNIIQKYIIDDIIQKVEFIDNHRVILPNVPILKESYIMKIIMRKVCHMYGLDGMKTKCVEQLSHFLNKKYIGKLKISLLKKHSTTINVDTIYFDRII